MREKSRIAGRVFTATMLISMLLVSSIAEAAPPAAAQKAPSQFQPAAGPAINALNPNAPPQGTITITSPASGEPWYTGGRKEVQWNCNGSCSLVDVSLWKDSNQFAVIGTGVGSGHTFYTMPSNTAVGNYELRVISEYDTRIVAKQTVAVSLPVITVAAPQQNEVLYTNSQYTITWKCGGDPGPVEVWLCCPLRESKIPNAFGSGGGSLAIVSAGTGGGSAVWTLPPDLTKLAPNPYNVLIARWKTGTKGYDILATSGSFSIACNPPTVSCSNNGYCIDLKTDANNCGACGKVCAGAGGVPGTGTAQCVNGSCVCPSPYAMCGTWCADLLRDARNCGGCGRSCPPYYSCVNGSCGCQSPSVMCGNTCTDLSTDNKNCGLCGSQCLASEYCSGYVCLGGESPPSSHGPGHH